MVINGYDAGILLKKTLRETWADNVLGLAAQAAYSFFFSLFPMLLFLTPLFGIIGNEQELVNKILIRLELTLPAEAYALLAGVVRDVVLGENAPGLISVGLVLAAYSGSAVLDTLAGALNQAYDASDPRPFWKKRLISMGFAAIAGVVIAISTIVMVAGHSAVDFLARFAGLSYDTARVWGVVQYPLALALLVGFLWLLFYFVPYAEQKKTHVLVGAIFTVGLWIVVTLVFRWYVANFGSYNKTYGTIGGVIILLAWMYWTMVALLTGGELNAQLKKGIGKVDAPQTRLPSDAIRDAAIAERARF
jgi:membrane protein